MRDVPQLVVAGEDEGHDRVARRIVDRILCQQVGWLDATLIASCRSWRFYHLPDAFSDARSAKLRVHGHFDGRPALTEARMYRALFLLMIHRGEVDALVVMRDADARARERREGFDQACGASRPPFPTVLGMPDPEVEAWAVHGFHPSSPEESERLAAVVEELGFSPVREPNRLTSRPNDAPTDAKRVLAALSGDDQERADGCIDRAVERLDAGSEECGLAAFVRAVRQTVPQVFSSTPG